MAGIKRKHQEDRAKTGQGSKKIKGDAQKWSRNGVNTPNGTTKKSKAKSSAHADELAEPDNTKNGDSFYDFSADQSDGEGPSDKPGSEHIRPVKLTGEQAREKKENAFLDEHGHLKSTSKEAHAQQKVLAKQRKAAKPNADSIARAKALWERLRRKSHVPTDERKKLVEELFQIIVGRVKDFVFKHDSTRVIQCALKYANQEQRKAIAKELKGEYRTLSESKYGKHMVAKLVVEGDKEIKDIIIGEFYGHIRKMINHPEASWILDDIYRAAASKDQKSAMLREWYGSEFAIFRSKDASKDGAVLSEILAESPEKRKPIMDYLQNLINQLIQKKLTGFTMLHDAMLQYYLNCKPGSEEAIEFLEKLKGEGDEEDKDYDLMKNLAFTASGSRVICLALAHGTAKDRRNILKIYKDMTEILSPDEHGHKALLVACEVVDDTVGLTKALFPKFLVKAEVSNDAQEAMLQALSSKFARIPLLCSLALETAGSTAPKWLLPSSDIGILQEVHDIRQTTSKKDSSTRRKEIISALSPALLAILVSHVHDLVTTAEGCQFVTEVLLGADGDKADATAAVIALASKDPNESGHISQDVSANRMLKTLIQGGHFDTSTKKIHQMQPSATFCELLYTGIAEQLMKWATGPGVWVVLALVEREGWSGRGKLLEHLRANKSILKASLKQLERSAPETKTSSDPAQEQGRRHSKAAMGGMKILLEKLD